MWRVQGVLGRGPQNGVKRTGWLISHFGLYVHLNPEYGVQYSVTFAMYYLIRYRGVLL